MNKTPSSPGTLRLAIIGCGRPLHTPGATGFGMAHRHIAAFRHSGRAELAAVADVEEDRAERFVAEHAPAADVFGNYLEMMEAVRPEIVSVCLWPHLHAEVVEQLAAFRPRLIFCEKPMDTHWEGACRMHQVCRDAGVTLAINHQRRFNLPLLEAKRLLREGTIGTLRRIEGAWKDLADSGSHVLDLMFYFNEDTPAQWVLGQIEMRGATRVFGQLHAGHGISTFRFANGVRGTYFAGLDHEDLGCLLRLSGDDGTLEILPAEPWLRYRNARTGGWKVVETGENIHDDKGIDRAVAHCLDCLERGEISELDSERALRPTEVLFATHESARRRGRVDLPLEPGPCAMLSMLEAGELTLPDRVVDPLYGRPGSPS